MPLLIVGSVIRCANGHPVADVVSEARPNAWGVKHRNGRDYLGWDPILCDECGADVWRPCAENYERGGFAAIEVPTAP